MLTVEQLQARRVQYVQGREGVAQQLEQVRAEALRLERQLILQDGALAAVDDLIKLFAPEPEPMAEMTMEELGAALGAQVEFVEA